MQKQPEPTHKFKVVVLGQQTVGKSTLIQRIISGTARTNISPTIGVQYCTYTVENEHAMLGIWDTSGDERYRSISNMHYRNADGIVLVYDVTSGESFGFLQSVWLREFKLHLREEDVVLAFVGNKSELPNHQVSKSQGEKLAKANNGMFFEVSALKGENVDEFIVQFTQRMIREKKRVEGQNREQLENLKKTEAVVLDKRRDGSGVAAAGNHGTKNCCNN